MPLKLLGSSMVERLALSEVSGAVSAIKELEGRHYSTAAWENQPSYPLL